MRALLVLILFLSACTSMQVENHLRQFNNAKELNLSGDKDKALSLWKELCEKKHKASCLLVGKDVTWHPGLAVMQGSTDMTSTTFAILERKNEFNQAFVYDLESKTIINSSRGAGSQNDFSEWRMSHFTFDKLKAGKEYTLVMMSGQGELTDYRKFKTLNKNKQNLKMAVTSCMADHYIEEQKMQWQDLASFKPDVLFMIGDNVYIDWGLKGLLKKVDEKMIWNRHVETRNKLEIFRQKELIPVFATWDDHDYGANNGGMNFPHKEDSKDIFLRFFPMIENDVVVSKGPGVSSAVKISKQNFLFMDDRYFRTPRNLKSVQSHFGEAQTKWALDQIKKSKGPVWIISGDQFFGGYHDYESFQGNHPDDFKKFLSYIRKTKKKVVFVSGDRHLSEIMEIPKKHLGYKTYELTSSGIHSTTYPGATKRDVNPLAIEAVDGVINYMIIDSQVKNKTLEIDIKDYGVNKNLLFKKKLKVH